MDSFDTQSNMLLSSLTLKASSKIENSLKEEFEKLPKKIQDLLKNLSDPQVFIVWSTED